MTQPRTDEEIVNSTNYNFNLSVDVLLSPQSRVSRNVTNPNHSPPRPQNSFMLYRRDKAASTEFSGLKAAEASKKISESWSNEPTEVRELFDAMARLAAR
jgi:hypothetical protein